MLSFITKSAAIASLAIAAIPFVALGSAAHAQTVRISDLDMSRSAQVQVFNGRVERAADQFCSRTVDARALDRMAACKAGVRAEMKEKAAAAQLTTDQARLGAMTVNR